MSHADQTHESTTVTTPDPRSGEIVLVIGSRNRKKCREMAELIAPPWEPGPLLSRLQVRSLDDYPQAPEVIEDADTFSGNARKKASEVAVAIGAWVLADDSGLAVDALSGAPGVYSARYAGEPSDDDANNRKLLENLASIPEERRTASFRCALALADPTGIIRLESEGACFGLITRDPRGPAGFGYDPLFLIREYHKTFGELSPLVKHQLSHRARAFSRLRRGLEQMVARRDFEQRT
jgi:XTP/dITP diphosphohydrolase